MRAYLLGGLIAGVLLLAGGKAAAHHSFAAEFDANKPIKLTGTVTKIEWTNPHVWFYINVKDEKTGEWSQPDPDMARYRLSALADQGVLLAAALQRDARRQHPPASQAPALVVRSRRRRTPEAPGRRVGRKGEVGDEAVLVLRHCDLHRLRRSWCRDKDCQQGQQQRSHPAPIWVRTKA